MVRGNKFCSYAITIWALCCAVLIGFFQQFSWPIAVVVFIPLVASLAFGKRYTDSGVAVCRILVGLLFIFSSFTKGIDPLGTKYKMIDYLYAYGMEWMIGAALVMAVVMILAEFIVGICLVTNILPRLATLGATLLMLFFTCTTFFDAKYDLVADCGCFGTAIKMTNWQTFFKNIIIDSILIPVIINNKRLKNKFFSTTVEWIAAVIFMAAFTWFEIFNIRHLPIIDFMPWKVGKDMKPKDINPDIYLTFRNKETGERQEYLTPNYPWNDSVWMSEWEYVSQRVENEGEVLLFSMDDEDGNDMTDAVFYSDRLFVFVAPYLEEITEDDLAECARIVDFARHNGCNYLWITSAPVEYVHSLQSKYDFFDETYYGDELEIKTMVRSNPGLMLMDNGIVIDKWSKIDFPSRERLDKLLNYN